MTTYAPEAHVRRGHFGWPIGVVVGLLALFLAGLAGYAIAGGFTSESSRGQEMSDGVMEAWATGDAASIAATYDPAVQVLLVYDGTEDVVAKNAKELTEAINGAIGFGNTYRQIGPVSTYQTEGGDLYVASTVEVTGPGHPEGVPLVGFYRVRNGRIIRHVFLDAEHY